MVDEVITQNAFAYGHKFQPHAKSRATPTNKTEGLKFRPLSKQ